MHSSFQNLLLACDSLESDTTPLLTVAIPHYKQRPYLEAVLESLFQQVYRDFEILVSDDCSNDDSNVVIPPILQSSGRFFRYYTHPKNLGYDGNVRFCLSAARGRYVFLLGNDDALEESGTLANIAVLLESLDYPEVAVTNFSDYTTGSIVRRAQKTQVLGSGPETAVRFFRSFSFVSGLIFDRGAAQLHETDQWDQSVYYQIYLASRIIASGGRVAGLNICAVRKDVTVEGQQVPSMYTNRWRENSDKFNPAQGLTSVVRVTADGILPVVLPKAQSKTLRQILVQVLGVSYGYWLFEYRRVATWRYAAWIAWGMWPGHLLAEYPQLKFWDRAFVWVFYLAVTLAGLLMPQRIFQLLKEKLASMIRYWQQRRRT